MGGVFYEEIGQAICSTFFVGWLFSAGRIVDG